MCIVISSTGDSIDDGSVMTILFVIPRPMFHIDGLEIYAFVCGMTKGLYCRGIPMIGLENSFKRKCYTFHIMVLKVRELYTFY